MNYQHTPVLLSEVLQYLNPKPNQNFIDCTLGLGGHAAAILKRTVPSGKLLAIEQNKEGLNEAKKNLEKFKNRTIYINDNFSNLDKIVRDTGFTGISGILLDLGLASWQIDDSNLGISFQKNEPLDMRLENPNTKYQISNKFQISNHKFQSISAEEIVNKYPLKKLADVLYRYGDVRNSYTIAGKILESRGKSPIKTTFELKRAIGTNNPKILSPIFQALRIEVNEELKNLQSVLPQAMEILELKGKLVVISYHSGEDRIVKNFLRDNKDQLIILTKKPIIPTKEEISQNPRARSAKMRVGAKN